MAGASPQSSQSDNSSGLLWIIAACFAAGAAIWYGYKAYIIAFYFKVKLAEIYLISFFTGNLNDVKTIIESSNPAKLNFQQVVTIGQAVGDYLRFPFVFILVCLAFLVYFANKSRVFKHTYSMRDLIDRERVNWPQINPVLNLNLLKTDLDQGPWAMALTPMQFCKKHQLLIEKKRALREGQSHRDWNKIEVELKRGQASKVFINQIGPLWPGTDKLPPHVKALFAALAARINADGKGSADLLESINRSAAGKLDFTGADALCKKYQDTKPVRTIVQSHAYLLTVMASMLANARQDGVQASADFLWLKPLDRRLWYMLNTVGRQTPFAEVAGPYAHWLAEKEIGRKILSPMIEEATNALAIALKEVVYKPDEPDDVT